MVYPNCNQQSKDFIKKRRYTEELTDTVNVFYDIPLAEMNIVDCICRMNPKLSVYITLRYYNEMTYEEMAKVMKQPVSTVKYKTKKALSELKKHL